MSAVAALAVASPAAVIAVSDLSDSAKPPTQHRQFVQAAMITDLPSELMSALSQGLSGEGRRDPPSRWSASTFVQVLDPDFFGGRDVFAGEMNFLADQSRANRPARADRPVRLPGDQAAQRIATAQAHGVDYDAATWSALAKYAQALGVAMPPVLA